MTMTTPAIVTNPSVLGMSSDSGSLAMNIENSIRTQARTKIHQFVTTPIIRNPIGARMTFRNEARIDGLRGKSGILLFRSYGVGLEYVSLVLYGPVYPGPQNQSSPDSRSSLPNCLEFNVDDRGDTQKSSTPSSHFVQASINESRPTFVISIVAVSASQRMFMNCKSSHLETTSNRSFVNECSRGQRPKFKVQCPEPFSAFNSFAAARIGEPCCFEL